MKRLQAIQKTLFLIAVCALLTGANAQNTIKNTPRETFLATPESLQQAGRAAQRAQAPLVILVSTAGCPWCELLRRQYLVPMRSEGIPAWQWSINDTQTPIADFSGQNSNGAALSKRYAVKFTPTLLFLNQAGQEIAPRIEGVASSELIGAVMDERLSIARKNLQQNLQQNLIQ